MKKTIIRKSFAILMALALLIYLPCGAMGDDETNQNGGSGKNPPATVTYKLTVDGNQVGRYEEGAEVEIKADPNERKRFTGWTATNYKLGEQTTVSTLKIKMPAKDVTFTGTYVTLYKLTVDDNTIGYYAQNEEAAISADTDERKQFTGWTATNYELEEQTTVPNLTIRMPANDVTFTGSYVALYKLEVDGTVAGYYAKDAEATITASVPDGKEFKGWTATGIDLTEEQQVASSLMINMPANAVTFTGTYQAKQADEPAQGTETDDNTENQSDNPPAQGTETGDNTENQNDNPPAQGTETDDNTENQTSNLQAQETEADNNTESQNNNPPAQGTETGDNTENQASNLQAQETEAGNNTESQNNNPPSQRNETDSNAGNNGNNPPVDNTSNENTTTTTQETTTQTVSEKEGAIVVSTEEAETDTTSTETARDPNKTYAPDGSEYNPNTGDTDKSGLVAVSGGAQGPSFNITDPVKTDTSKYQLTTARTTGSVKTVSSTGTSSGPAGATATTSTDNEEDTDGDDKTDEADGTDGAAYEGVYSIAGGYNVILIGLAESNIQSETWPLLMQRGIVFEDFERGEDAPEDTEALLQDGIEGVKQDGTSNYWNSPSAAATAGDLINQFGFYGMMEEEKQTDDAQMLAKTAERITGEGLVMNARNIPFFMDVQFTGNGGQGDTLRQLITELENDGLGGNTVLIFTQTGKEAKGPLVIVHPVVWENMTVETPMKAEDLLTTILSLSGQAKASQYEQLGMPAGKNLLTMDELQGIVGLVPELKAEEEVTADAEETTERDDSEGDISDSPKFKMPEGVKKNGMLDGIEQEKNRIEINRTKVTTNPNGQGSGPAAPGSDVPKSNGPGGDSDQDDYSAGPGGSGNGETSYSAGPGGSGNADDSYSAGPGGTGAGEVYSVGPGGGGSDGGPAHP